MFTYFLDLLFPRKSLQGQEGMHMTEEEFGALVTFPVQMETDQLRASGVQFLDRLVAASSYESSPLLKAAMHRLKYGRQRAYERELGTILAEASLMIMPSDDMVLCPVPLHWTRERERGFNQSMCLARVIAEERQWPLALLLKRVRATGHQAHRSHSERHYALQDAFMIAEKMELPPRVILIDDVATTGSTLDICARVLKEGGVTSVEALVIAKG
jgi:ComF family protein